MDSGVVGEGEVTLKQLKKEDLSDSAYLSVCLLALPHKEHLCSLVWRVEGEFVTMCAVACKEPVAVLENEYPSDVMYELST